MSPELWIAIGGQTVIIMGGIAALHLRTRERITALEEQHKSCDKLVILQRKDHDKLDERVNGISRKVERLDARIE